METEEAGGTTEIVEDEIAGDKSGTTDTNITGSTNDPTHHPLESQKNVIGNEPAIGSVSFFLKYLLFCSLILNFFFSLSARRANPGLVLADLKPDLTLLPSRLCLL